MITYSQSLTKVWLNRLIIGSGYSGNGDALNNPALENMVGHGPIPRGMWEILSWSGETKHGTKGKQVAILKPIGHDAHNRSGFLWHGDTQEMNFSASDGCIVSARVLRDHLAAAWIIGARSLEVIG